MRQTIARMDLVNYETIKSIRNPILKDMDIEQSVEPDIYAKLLDSHRIIIGEAKTSDSLLGRHAEEQIKDFIYYCASNDDCIFVLAVPWNWVRRARSLLKILKAEELNSIPSAVLVKEKVISTNTLAAKQELVKKLRLIADMIEKDKM